MPSISVLPSSPAHSPHGLALGISKPSDTNTLRTRSSVDASSPSYPSTSGATTESTVAGIKEKVHERVRSLHGASALSLLRSAHDQALSGFDLEREGDLRGAFRALLTAAELSQAVLNSPEFQEEKKPGRKGVVWKEFNDYSQDYGMSVTLKAKELQDKLLELEKARGTESELPASTSVKDRVRALQEKGLDVRTTKRTSRELSSPVPSATSPSIDWKAHSVSRAPSHQSTTSAGVSANHIHPSSVTNHHTGSSIQSVIASSSLGPSSPSSESPRFSGLSLTEFNSAFPSIDELDEGMNAAMPSLPSVPAFKPGVGALQKSPPTSPSVFQRFPSLPLDLDPSPRPASTPISPTFNGLPSRPPSPNRFPPQRNPLSPTIPPKPMKLTMTGSSSSTRTSPARTTPLNTGDSPRSRGIELPVTNTILPKTLREYMNHPNEVKVLLIDLRTREEYSACHIKSDTVLCIEPYVLLRDEMNSDKLEDALAVSPPHELALFRNRDLYDLVVLYDAGSESFGSSLAPTSAAVRVIYETATIHRSLKRPPVLLVGGLKAWRGQFPNDVVSTDPSSSLDLHMDRMKLYNTSSSGSSVNGSSYTSYTPPTSNGRETSPANDYRSPSGNSSRPQFVMDQIPEVNGSGSPEVNGKSPVPEHRRLVRKPAMTRPPSTSSITFNTRGLYDNSTPYLNGTNASSSSSIVYPQYPRPPTSSFATSGIVSPPPTASINPSSARRRSDYVDQSEQAVSSFANRSGIDYPNLTAQHVVRPPPAAAPPQSERQDHRRGSGHRSSLATFDGPRPPTISSDYPVVYWPDNQISTAGLKNLGNTCYMNSTIQCLSATTPFSRFFTDGRWKNAVNMVNLLGTKGQLTAAFASILHDLWHQESPVLTPNSFRKSVCSVRSGQIFAGSEQHDSQEFLNFLLDGLHEDLNRVLAKQPVKRTPEEEAELELLPQQIASQQEWDLYRMRDNSIVVDFFQGQFRNRLQCLTCRKTSTTYNSFMYLTLPIPNGRNAKATLHQCLDAFVHEEVMEKEDAWQCPNCKTLRRATKQLSLSRLPPVLLIHLKRFTQKGHFTDKLETFIDFPLRGLDLTNYMPPPLPPGIERKKSAPINLDDPRSQVPPYKYDLYAVTNHFGTLSSGHYTAFINSRGNWLYCDDSRITGADAREVVGKPAYVLYYKRVQS